MKVIDDIFTDDEINQIHKEFNSLITTDSEYRQGEHQWRTNRYAWQPYLYQLTTGHVLSHPMSLELKPIVIEKIKKFVEPTENMGINYFIWGPGSGIYKHCDEGYRGAFTFYLQDWPIEWGGQLVAEIDGQACIIPAKYNRMVVNDNETEHWVTPVRNIKDYSRHTIQVFVR